MAELFWFAFFVFVFIWLWRWAWKTDHTPKTLIHELNEWLSRNGGQN